MAKMKQILAFDSLPVVVNGPVEVTLDFVSYFIKD